MAAVLPLGVPEEAVLRNLGAEVVVEGLTQEEGVGVRLQVGEAEEEGCHKEEEEVEEEEL